MLSHFLVRLFVPDYQNISDSTVRKKYGILGGTVGIIVNVILFILKLAAGLAVNSIAMLADAFNNLSDVASSLVTVFGFILAGKPADKEHPFGHGRLEYIAGLIVSFLVILIGYEFFKTSLGRIINPGPVEFSIPALLLLIIAMLSKVWLFIFNRYLAKAINSQALSASSLDSISDVISTACVALSLVIFRWTAFPIDGYIGLVISGIIIYTGINLTRETISPLLGEPAPAELVETLVNKVLSYPQIMNIHDLIIHNYGPGQYLASLHVEIPSTVDIMAIHETIDQIERDVARDLNLILSIHMDPINQDSAEYQKSYREISEITARFKEIVSFHDLRIVGQGEKQNIIFDIVVSPGLKPEREQEIIKQITEGIKEIHPHYNCIISVDQLYS